MDFSGYQIKYFPSLMYVYNYTRAHSGSRNHNQIAQTLLLVNENGHNMLINWRCNVLHALAD